MSHSWSSSNPSWSCFITPERILEPAPIWWFWSLPFLLISSADKHQILYPPHTHTAKWNEVYLKSFKLHKTLVIGSESNFVQLQLPISKINCSHYICVFFLPQRTQVLCLKVTCFVHPVVHHLICHEVQHRFTVYSAHVAVFCFFGGRPQDVGWPNYNALKKTMVCWQTYHGFHINIIYGFISCILFLQ